VSESEGAPELSYPSGLNAEKLAESRVAVLISGGVESAILTSLLKEQAESVHPIYVACGLAWEDVEQQYLSKFIGYIRNPRVAELKVLSIPAADVYGTHWSVTGKDVPDASTPDEAVALPGRNLLLYSKAAIWCAMSGINLLAAGQLGSNPFPDSSDKFFQSLKKTCAVALDFEISFWRPFKDMEKAEVLQLGKDLPLHLTFSCIKPEKSKAQAGLNYIHCGDCNKCAERRRAFEKAGIEDKTTYAKKGAINVSSHS